MFTPNEKPVLGSPEDIYAVRASLPLRSERLDGPPSRELCDAAERRNAGVFGFLLQGVDLEAMARPADERLAEALAPLRAKLDMLIEMLAKLSYREVALPPVRAVELHPGRIGWHSPEPCQSGDWLRVELYFHPTFREPVTLFAQVTRCSEPEADGWRISADLFEMPETLTENLVRLALLTQRHQQARHSSRAAARRET